MVEVDTSVERRHGVTFVRATVKNTRSTPRTVRLVNCLDGPTWQPRSGDVTVPEWRGDTWEKSIKAGQRVGFGYASPAEPVEPALETVSVSRVGDRTCSTCSQTVWPPWT